MFTRIVLGISMAYALVLASARPLATSANDVDVSGSGDAGGDGDMPPWGTDIMQNTVKRSRNGRIDTDVSEDQLARQIFAKLPLNFYDDIEHVDYDTRKKKSYTTHDQQTESSSQIDATFPKDTYDIADLFADNIDYMYPFKSYMILEPIGIIDPSDVQSTELTRKHRTVDPNDALRSVRKRGFSMLARWKPFSSIGRQRSPIRLGVSRASSSDLNRFVPEYSGTDLDIVSAETRARPMGQPLRWG